MSQSVSSLHFLAPQSSTDFPITQWITSSFSEVSEQVDRSCRRYLAGFNHADVSPEDARQNVLAEILTLGFARRFDPQKGSIMQFIHGVTRHECHRMIALHYRKLKHQRELLDTAASPVRGPDIAAELAEFVEALHEAKNKLTPAESAALPDVMDGAFHKLKAKGPKRSVRRVRATRCRQRLAIALVRFTPD
jgi:DNA-directed RNA polymerase specialized sigma24 family protein